MQAIARKIKKERKGMAYLISYLKYCWWKFRVKRAIKKVVKRWCKERGRGSNENDEWIFKLGEIEIQWKEEFIVWVWVRKIIFDKRFGLVKKQTSFTIGLPDQRQVRVSTGRYSIKSEDYQMEDLVKSLVETVMDYGVNIVEDDPREKSKWKKKMMK